jgi:hypothetical protein
LFLLFGDDQRAIRAFEELFRQVVDVLPESIDASELNPNSTNTATQSAESTALVSEILTALGSLPPNPSLDEVLDRLAVLETTSTNHPLDEVLNRLEALELNPPVVPIGLTGPAGPTPTDFDNGNAFTVYSVADFDFESGDA